MALPELSESFEQIGGRLEIELSEPPKRVGNLLNEQASPDATLKGLKLIPEVYDEDLDETREVTQAELDSIAYPAPVIKLCSESEEVFTFHAANGKHFTVRELLAAIEDAERKSGAIRNSSTESTSITSTMKAYAPPTMRTKTLTTTKRHLSPANRLEMFG